MKLLREMYAIAREDKRTDVPLSKLRIGLKCGGSDGLSGITANPMLGVFSGLSCCPGWDKQSSRRYLKCSEPRHCS